MLLPAQTLYAMDALWFFPTVTYNGLSYTDTYCSNGTGGLGGFLTQDRTPSMFWMPPPLGISDCADNGFYCPSSTLTLSNIGLTGYGSVGSGTISLSIANADQLFSNNPTFAAFNDIASDSGTGPSTDDFDLGLPFFLGRTVFVGIAGSTVPNGATAPYGYVAF